MSDEALRLYVRYSLWFDRRLGPKGYRTYPPEEYQRRGRRIAAMIDMETVTDV